jgi:hypothetical protein
LGNYVKKHFSEERVNYKTTPLDFLGLPELRGKTFLDIAARQWVAFASSLQAVAEKIISFDNDYIPYRLHKKTTRYSGNPSIGL